MDERGISGDDQKVVKDFLRYLPFQKRQQLMGVLIGFPEELPSFIDILKRKMVLAERFDVSQAQAVFDIEREKIDDLIKQI